MDPLRKDSRLWLYVPETPPEVTPDDLAVLSLYTGSAMLDEALAAAWEELTGRRAITVGRCERDSHAAASIVARVEEEALDRAPIWDDSRTFPCRTFRKKVGAVTAGFPCQPWSNAGARLGIQDPRWLWPDIVRIVRGVGAGVVFLENVPPILCGKATDEPGWSYPPGAWFVLRDLAAMGFDAEWCVVPASAMGAAHERRRWFCLAVHHSLLGRRDKGDDDALRSARGTSGLSGPLRDSAGLRLGKAKRGKAGRQRSNTSGPLRNTKSGGRKGLGLPARQGREGQGAADAQRALAESLPHPARVLERKPGTEERTVARWKSTRADPGRRSRQPVPDSEDAAAARGLSKRTSKAQSRSKQCDSGGLPDAGSPGRPQGTEDVRTGQPQLTAPCGDDFAFFAPGPHGWGPLWDTHLAPAIESGVCVLADGLALVVDASRVDQLRLSGNGVVALQAAVAAIVLGRRLEI